MNIDWSKAPEGATHWDTGMNNRVAGWMKLDDGVWYWWPAADAFSCPKKWHASLNQHMIKTEGFVDRPAPWTGEGLPPVGTVCEVQHPDKPDTWCKCTILVWDSGCAVFSADANYPFAYDGNGYPESFRPIRTPEQIAAEEHRARYMPQLIQIWDADTSREDFLEAVYEMIREAHTP